MIGGIKYCVPGNRLKVYGNYAYAYTANGELATKTNTATSETTAYEYDVLGNLRSVTLADGTVIDYVIDGRNRRVGKKVNGTLERSWIYDGQLRPVAEMDGSGVLVSQFVYATHINVPDYMVKGGVTYRILTDHLGSLRFVIDTATGTIAQRIDYDDWGNVITNTNADFTPFGFAGGMYDSQTKLTRFGARDYDAEVGRWTAKDPIGFGGGSFLIYSYMNEDPVQCIDASGLASAAGCCGDKCPSGNWVYVSGPLSFTFVPIIGGSYSRGKLKCVDDPHRVQVPVAIKCGGAGFMAAVSWDVFGGTVGYALTGIKDPCDIPAKIEQNATLFSVPFFGGSVPKSGWPVHWTFSPGLGGGAGYFSCEMTRR